MFGMHYKGLSVKKQEKLRHSLPPNSQMIVCKNSLLRVAVDKQPQWKVTGDIAQVRIQAPSGLNSRVWPCMRPHLPGVLPLGEVALLSKLVCSLRLHLQVNMFKNLLC